MKPGVKSSLTHHLTSEMTEGGGISGMKGEVLKWVMKVDSEARCEQPSRCMKAI